MYILPLAFSTTVISTTLTIPKRLRAGGEGINRGLDVWMASPTQWT